MQNYCYFSFGLAEKQLSHANLSGNLPTEVLDFFQQIMKIAVDNFSFGNFRLPKTFTINAIDNKHESQIRNMLLCCGIQVKDIKHLDSATTIILC